MKKIIWMVMILLCISNAFADRPANGGFEQVQMGDYSYRSVSQHEKVVTLISDPSHYNKITIGKWDNNTYFDIFMPASTDGNIYYDNGTLTINYNLFQGVIYMSDNDTMEWEGVFTRRPNPNQLVFIMPLNMSDNLQAYYQAPLDVENNNYTNCNATDCWYDDGTVYNHRPFDVVGSYAFYIDKSGNDYKTGKMFDIKRIKLIDNNGDIAYGILNITRTAMTITLPSWLRTTAVMPVTLDPTFGYTSIGSSSSNAINGYIRHYQVNLTEDGTVVNMSFHNGGVISWSGGLAIYDNTAIPNQALLSNLSSGTFTTGWNTYDIADVELTAGIYWLAVLMKQSVTNGMNYDSKDGISTAKYKQSTFFPDPMGTGQQDDIGTIRWSMYASYNVGGGGGGTDSCSYCVGGSNCNISCSDTCLINNSINMEGYNLTLTGTGNIVFKQTVRVNNIFIPFTCAVNITNNSNLWSGV